MASRLPSFLIIFTFLAFFCFRVMPYGAEATKKVSVHLLQAGNQNLTLNPIEYYLSAAVYCVHGRKEARGPATCHSFTQWHANISSWEVFCCLPSLSVIIFNPCSQWTQRYWLFLLILWSFSKEEALASIVYSYRHGFSGFAAMLTESQAKLLAGSTASGS